VLDAEGVTIGAVEDLQGISWQEIVVTVGTRPDEDAIARGEAGEEGEPEGNGAAAKGAKLGVKLQALTPDLARQLRVEGDTGVIVAEVDPDGAAARAGIQRGDLILEVNRSPVTKPEQVSAAVSKAKPGDVVLLRVKRGSNASFVPVRIPEPEAPAKK